MLTKAEHDLHALFGDRVKNLDEAFLHARGDQAIEADRLFKMSSDLAEETVAIETKLAGTESESKEAALGAHKQLQSLLAKIYSVGWELEKSAAKPLVISRLRKELKDKAIAVDAAASLMKILVKFVVRGAKKQSTHTYTRVLDVALAKRLAPEAFAKELADNGVTNLAKTPKQVAEAEQAAIELKERITLQKEAVRHLAKDFKPMEWTRGVIQMSPTDPGDLLLCMGVAEEGDKIRLAYCVQLDSTQENAILASVSASIGLHELRGAVANPVGSLAASPPQKKGATRRENNDVLG